MGDTIRLIDAAIRQAQEPVECPTCGQPLTGRELRLYFCSRDCETVWRNITFRPRTNPGGLRADYPWAGERPAEPDVRYPEADHGWLRDAEGERYIPSRHLPMREWAESLKLWMDDPHYCDSCMLSLTIILQELRSPLPDRWDIIFDERADGKKYIEYWVKAAYEAAGVAPS